MTAPAPGPSVARYVSRTADATQVEELLVHRSLYTLMEADPHTWAIPRLSGAPKAALVEVQADEYGGGRPERMHSALFARTMRGVGLGRRATGPTSTAMPAVTIASLNLMSLFGLHRRLARRDRGPPRRVRDDVVVAEPAVRRRLPAARATTRAPPSTSTSTSRPTPCTSRSPAGTWPDGWRSRSPSCVDDILFGAAACLYLDDLVGRHLLDAWSAGTSSLRAP